MDNLAQGVKNFAEQVSRTTKDLVRRGRAAASGFDSGVLESQVADSATFEVRPPFNFKVRQSLIDNGFIDANGNLLVRSIFLRVNNNIDNTTIFAPNRKIIGKSAIDFEGLNPQDLGLQFGLSIHEKIDQNGYSDAGVNIDGVAFRDDQEQGVFRLGEGAIGYDFITSGENVAIVNQEETRFNQDGSLDADDVAIQFTNIGPNLIGDIFGVRFNTQEEIGNPRINNFAKPYLAKSDGKVYKTGDGFSVIARIDDASSGVPSVFPDFFGTTDYGYPLIVAANFNSRGMLLGFKPIFSFKNTGQNLIDSTDGSGNTIKVQSPYVPNNGEPLSGSEVLNIRDFRTEQSTDGKLVVAIAYERRTGSNSLTNAETATNIMVLDNNGNEISSARDFRFFQSTVNPVFQRSLRSIAGIGVSLDNSGVFVSTAIGGATQAQGFFISTNNSDPQNPVTSVAKVDSSQYSSVQSFPNKIVNPEQPFSRVEFLPNGQIQVSAAYGSAKEIENVINTVTHVMESGEEYIPLEENLAVPQRIIVPAGVNGATILFPEGVNYTYVDQSGNNSTTLLFSEVPQGHDFRLQNVIDPDGTPSVKAHFPNNTNVVFYGESQEHVQNVLSNLRTLTTTVAATPESTQQPTEQTTTPAASSSVQMDSSPSSTPRVTDSTPEATEQDTTLGVESTEEKTENPATTSEPEPAESSQSSSQSSTAGSSSTPTITTTFSAATNYSSSDTNSTMALTANTSPPQFGSSYPSSTPMAELTTTNGSSAINGSMRNITDSTPGNKTNNTSPDDKQGAIVGGSVAGAVLFVGFVAAFLIRRWYNQRRNLRTVSPEQAPVEEDLAIARLNEDPAPNNVPAHDGAPAPAPANRDAGVVRLANDGRDDEGRA